MFEVWFEYRGSRRWRACRDEEQRDSALEYLQSIDGVTDIDVIDTEES